MLTSITFDFNNALANVEINIKIAPIASSLVTFTFIHLAYFYAKQLTIEE